LRSSIRVFILAFLCLPLLSCGIACTPKPENTNDPIANFRMVTFFASPGLKQINNINWAAFTDAVFEYIDVDSTSGNLKYSWPLSDITQFINKVKAKGVKPWVSVASDSWPNSSFFPVITSDARQTFINNLLTFCLENHLYGVTLDIEPVSDPKIFSDFVIDLSEHLSKVGLKVSITGEPRHLDILPEAVSSLEWIDVMSYDIYYTVGYPQHSRYEDSVQAMELYTNSGIDKSKLLMGIPFFGRDGSDNNFYYYRNIVNKYSTIPSTNFVEDPSIPGGMIWWNGPDLVKQKINYVLSDGYYGVAVYDASLDVFDDRSLLSVIVTALNSFEIEVK
jgi:chitinase